VDEVVEIPVADGRRLFTSSDYEDDEVVAPVANGASASATATTGSKDQKGSYVGVHR
jgi:hypothetical protein